MRPFNQGESFFHLIKQAIPNFIEADYPLFVEFVTAYLRFLEQPRTFTTTTITPEFGTTPTGTIDLTDDLGGSLFESRKLLEYRDVDSSLNEFKSHFLAMFAKNFPQYQYVPTDLLVRALRQFYDAKGTTDSIEWFFRVLFNEHAEIYYPRTDVLRASDGTWSAPITLKVSAPLFGRPNGDVALFYIGQRVQTSTGSAQVESVVTNIVGQAYNQNIIVNELKLKFDSILGTFAPGQHLLNIDSDDQVETIILPVISDVIVNQGGSNYAAGDSVLFSEGPAGGGGYQAFGAVALVSNTAINGVTVLNGGDGFIVGLPLTFISTTGKGASAVISEIVYGDFLLEDSSGYLTNELQDVIDTNFLVLEDKNTLILELTIEPFVNATATVTLDSADYGAATGVAQMNGVVLDSAIEIALAATDEKPFTHPWVFTNPSETTAELANASAELVMTGNTFFANGAQVFSIPNLQSLANISSAIVSANVIVSDTSNSSNLRDTLYLKQFTGFHSFATDMVLKASGNGVLQTGTVTTDGTANVVGTGTNFVDILQPNQHIRFGDGTHAVVRAVVNNTYLTTFSATGVTLTNNTYSIVPVGTVDAVTFAAQRYYGKIKTIQLLTNGSGYATPPAVVADSISARAQEKTHIEPNPASPFNVESANNTFVSSGTQIDVFSSASLQVRQDSGQVQKVKILNSGVNYQDANTTQIVAVHGAPRTGSEATFTPVIGALTQYPGEFTTTKGFLSSDKFLQDADYYNDYTYEVRVAESFDRYRDILLKLLHPAGFKALGRFVAVLNAPVCTANVTMGTYAVESYPTTIIRDGAAAYYRLNETGSPSQANDSTSNAFHLTTVVNSPTFGQTGPLADGNTSVLFNGTNQRIVQATGFSWTGKTAISMECWIKANAAWSGTNMIAFDLGDNGNYVGFVSGNLLTSLRIGGTQRVTNGGAVANSGWHHVAVTWKDTDYIRTYIDGVLSTNSASTFTGTISSEIGISIAAFHTTSPSGWFPGFLAECALYNLQLSSAQIAKHYALRTRTVFGDLIP